MTVVSFFYKDNVVWWDFVSSLNDRTLQLPSSRGSLRKHILDLRFCFSVAAYNLVF